MASTGLIIPTLAAVVDRVRGDIDSTLPGADSRLRRTALSALSLGLGGASWLLHKFGGEIAKETLPDCASETGVKRWQSMWGLPDVQPQQSQGNFIFTGVNGSVVPEGQEIIRNDEVAYTVDVQLLATRTITGGVATIAVTAVETGTDGDAVTGQIATLSTPVAGVDSQATVDTGITGGIDAETVEQTRTRVLDRMADPPQGGANADFVQWVKEAVPGVRTVYVGANEPSFGFVTFRFILDPVDGSGNPTGDPADALASAAQYQTAMDYIAGTAANNFEDGVSPVPIAKPLTGDDAQVDGRISGQILTGQSTTFQISALVPSTDAVKASISDSLKALMLARSVPGGTVTLSQWIGAIDAAPGETSHVLDLINGVTAADVAVGTNSLLTLGAVVYV